MVEALSARPCRRRLEHPPEQDQPGRHAESYSDVHARAHAATLGRLREPSEHHEVGVKPHSFDPAHAEEREAVGVFQAAELALYRRAAAVEAGPFRGTRLIGVSG